jgi:TRAP-type C4-dicarboxylate transport system substrate-binding protein
MFLRALPALILLASAASAAAAAEFTLKFGTIYARDSSGFAEVMLPLKKRLEEQSNGRLEIELGGLGEFSRPAALLSLVEQGKVEIGMTVQGYHPGRFPLSAVMELPLIYETAEQGTFAMWQLFAEGPIAKDYADFKLLATYTLPPYGILSAVKVETLKDLRGLRVRAPSLAVGLALNRLGMIPVGLPLDWIGMGLAQNHIDAITYGFESAATAAGDGGKRLLEQVTHLLDARIAAPALMIAMNKSAFDKLPADLRGVIDANFGL